MNAIVTDTHALIWYLEDSPRLSQTGLDIFTACTSGQALVYIPTICLVEIVYLQEKGRIPASAMTDLQMALQTAQRNFLVADLSLDVALTLQKIPRLQVPDMPDRIIAATALSLNLPLLSRDRKIQLAPLDVIW